MVAEQDRVGAITDLGTPGAEELRLALVEDRVGEARLLPRLREIGDLSRRQIEHSDVVHGATGRDRAEQHSGEVRRPGQPVAAADREPVDTTSPAALH